MEGSIGNRNRQTTRGRHAKFISKIHRWNICFVIGLFERAEPRRSVMFQPRSRDFSDPHVSAIVDHLRAVEGELAEIGRKAGRRTSATASAAGDQIADAITPILNDIADRFWRGQRAAVGGAANLGDQAVKIGAKVGSDALGRISSQAKERPLLTLAVAIGVGILIGAASRRN
jgi:hypothetical protein